ncbi:tetratricopeptide repeat protein [Fulvivirga lutimaris]|uniref:tetratricopeptide repeat protein n=1 Tax=Fulvivirga lutimaris TaxID=1819566 RepID=UPI0012BD30CB|nr:tetratricopeptide repeat protein [Fulvivirga lutimaris]MTI39135.1 tetratricopeptide repeat protein [Fulvivirga lutimaris]
MRFLLIFFLALVFLPVVGQKDVSDSVSLKEEIQHLNQKTVSIWLNFPDSAMNYARLAYQKAKKLDDPKLLSSSLRLIGGVHYYKGNYDSVIHYSNLSLKIAQELQDSVLMNNVLNNLGLAHNNMGSYQNALEYLLRSLNLKKALKQEYGLVLNTNNIGLVYQNLKDYGTAREYFLEALDIAERQKDNNLILYSQNNAGFTYLSQNNLEQAENYFRRSMAIDVDNKNWKAVTFSGMGQVYQLRGQFKDSRVYFDKALELRHEIGDKRGISEIYYMLSNENYLNQNYDSALFHLNHSQKIAEEISAKDRIFDNYELFAKIYHDVGSIDNAFFYQDSLLRLRDVLFNENMARNLAGIQLKIQEEENQRALSLKEEELERERQFVIFLIVVIVLILITVVITLYQVRINKKKNKALNLRNQEISQQKVEIEVQKETLLEKNAQLETAQRTIKNQNDQLEKYNRQLKTAVDEQSDQLKERNDQLMLANLELDNFIYKSSHDIKGPLATLLGMCNVALLDVEEDKARNYFEMLNETALGLNSILARLKTVSDISSLDLKFREINFSKIIEECVEQNRKIEGDESISVKYKIDHDLSFVSDPTLLDLIFFNIIQSVIKMRDTDMDSHDILITLKKNKFELDVDIMDHESGPKNKELGDVFKLFAKSALHHRTLGLGLYIVKQSVIKLGGSIVLLDDENHTHFKIKLPIT